MAMDSSAHAPRPDFGADARPSDTPPSPPSGLECVHTQIPPIPTSFPQLESKTLSVLQVLDNFDDERKQLIRQFESVKVLESMLVELVDSNARTARELQEEQRRLRGEDSEVARLQERIQEEKANKEEKERRLRSLLSRRDALRAAVDPRAIARTLHERANEYLQSSEEKMESFREGNGRPPPTETAAQKAWIEEQLHAIQQERRRFHELEAKARLADTFGVQEEVV